MQTGLLSTTLSDPTGSSATLPALTSPTSTGDTPAEEHAPVAAAVPATTRNRRRVTPSPSLRTVVAASHPSFSGEPAAVSISMTNLDPSPPLSLRDKSVHLSANGRAPYAAGGR